MTAPNLAERLPEGYLVERGQRGVLAVLREYAPALRAAGYGLDGDALLTQSAFSGRKPLLEIPTPVGVFLVRRFSHGGLLRFLTRERFADPARPFRELSVSASLSRAGVKTPQVAAARALAARGWGWRLEIVTRRVDGAIDLDQVLASARGGEVDPRALRALARATGRLVRALHDAGCSHADLTTKNMLVDRSALAGLTPRVWILDLDRARIEVDLSSAERRASLARLWRYVARRERMRGSALSRTDWARFLTGYEPQRERRKSVARAVLAAHARSRAWHEMGWKLERLFARR